MDSIERLNRFANMTFLYGNRVSLDMDNLKKVQQDLKRLLAEREKYTIRLTDEEYRKVIENAQKDIAEQKDKRIQELEKENADLKKYNKTVSDRIVEYKKNSIPTQVVTDLIQEYKDKIERYDEYRIQGKETDVEYYENIANTAIVQVLQELLEGEE